MFLTEYRSFREHIREIASVYLSRSKTDDSAFEMMKSIYEAAEKEVHTAIPPQELKEIACAKGCSVCCRVNVAVLSPEVSAIKHYLYANRTETEMESLKKKLTELYRDVRYLDEEERLFTNRQCAFLEDDGSCGIYEMRPFLCRSVTSANASTCREAVSMIALGTYVFVPMNIAQKSLMDAAFMGLADALDDYSVPSGSSELTKSVLDTI